jgi:beta-galactosidase
VALLAGVCAAAEGEATSPRRESILLDAPWKVQPATTPDRAPDPGQWGTCDLQDWRWRMTVTGAPWSVKRQDVHCLWYEKEVVIPANWAGKRILVYFDTVEGDAVVFANGQRVAEFLAPCGEVDVTAFARPGERNALQVYLTRNYTGISRTFEQDVLRYTGRGPGAPYQTGPDGWALGLTRPATLCARPHAMAVTDVFVKPSWRRQAIELEVELTAEGPAQDLVLAATIVDAEGRQALEFSRPAPEIPAGVSTHSLTSAWEAPIPWELEKPYLYRASVAVRQGESALDAAPTVSFGFREIWHEGRALMMNGHPVRFRTSLALGLSPANLSFFRLMGLNVFQFQPNPTHFYSVWSEWPLEADELLEALDRQGLGAIQRAPTAVHLDQRLLDDPEAEAAYRQEVGLWLRRQRNHPCILGWTPTMNYTGNIANIHADGMGRSSVCVGNSRERVLEQAIAIIKAIDPTRFVFGHHDGNVGDISSSNTYLNFVPLQEREEWPSEYAAQGDLPYMVVEFGQPATLNYWKGSRFLCTEYLAIYFGEEAYARESEAGLRQVLEWGALGPHQTEHTWVRALTEHFPMQWDLHRLFIGNTDRAWRTWDVNGGWFYWDFELGYGDPPGFTFERAGDVHSRYGHLTAPVTSRPPWANPNFDIHARTMQPLLVYLAGAPVHTDKSHSFYAGETVRKQIAWVWDGPGTRELTAEWTATDDRTGTRIAGGTAAKTLEWAGISFSPVVFEAPTVPARTGLTLALRVTERGQEVAADRLSVQVFPRPGPLVLDQAIGLWDPVGKSGPWLRELGLRCQPVAPGADLSALAVLILGREALQKGGRLPYSAADVDRGLKVLILEQLPEMWEALGFRAIEAMPRYVYSRDRGSPVLAGLEAEDLVNWRGSPDLLPEKKTYRSHDAYHAPKWTNTHAVASVALEVPQVVGFTPILACEFDLNYTPLLRWQYGKGVVYCATLDFSDRVGHDPGATLLARNLLAAVAAEVPETRRVAVAGTDRDRELVQALQPALSEGQSADPATTVLLAGEGGLSGEPVLRFAREGGAVVSLCQTGDSLSALGYRVAEREVYRVAPARHALLRGIGGNLLRFRDAMKVPVFAPEGQPDGSEVLLDGLCLVRGLGRGRLVFLQLDPGQLAGRYAAEDSRRAGVWPSVERGHQFLAQVLTNCGVASSQKLAERVCRLEAGAAFQWLRTWQACGPFVTDSTDGQAMLSLETPAEYAVISGQPNVDDRYAQPDGRVPDWRTALTAREDGFVDLGRLGQDQRAVAYVLRQVESQTERTAQLRLGFDYFLRVWVNGEMVYDCPSGHGGAPIPDKHKVNIRLRQGTNAIGMKVAAGSKGFGFWAKLSEEGVDFAPAAQAREGVELYPRADRSWDPYLFQYY